MFIDMENTLSIPVALLAQGLYELTESRIIATVIKLEPVDLNGGRKK